MMTDTEKLDLLLEKVTKLESLPERVAKLESLPEKVAKLTKDMGDVKSDLKRLHKSVKRLHQDDMFILDEIERVHHILEQHMSNRSVHMA
jgi:predicted nuclease with TOPRIM domain